MVTGVAVPEGHEYTALASYRRCAERVASTWPSFVAQRAQRLRQGLFDAPVEKVAENILEDLLTKVLDWDLSGVNLQVGRADIVLSDLGVKRLVLEVKRPGSLAWHSAAVRKALEQAVRYADDQKVPVVAVSDGQMLYAADVANGGLRDRLFAPLDSRVPPVELWWLSVHGIYRPCPTPSQQLPGGPATSPSVDGPVSPSELLHRKYCLPARCFAYVGSAGRPESWKLPYLLADGSPDLSRLPKAIQAILSNYRGARVTIPREAVSDVLVRLGKTAAALGKMPCQCAATAGAYVEAHRALDQLGRLLDVGCCR